MLFTAGSVDALAATVADLLRDRDSWSRLRANGRRFVEQERTWKRSVSNYVPVYERLRDSALA